MALARASSASHAASISRFLATTDSQRSSASPRLAAAAVCANLRSRLTASTALRASAAALTSLRCATASDLWSRAAKALTCANGLANK